MADTKKTFLEKIGVGLTTACAIHCIATPFVITSLPLAGNSFTAIHKYENYIIYLSLFLALALLRNDFRSHKNERPMLLIIIAIVVKIIFHFIANSAFELPVTVLISCLIIVAYWLNWKHKERCSCHLPH